nr:50S ribosomal protein L18 [Bangiopsis subsimplex]
MNQRNKKKFLKKVNGSSQRPRLTVYRSNQHIYAQIIDDIKGNTLVQCSTIDKELKSDINNSSNCQASAAVGKLIASRAIAKGFQKVIFDRHGKLYHGRIKALAEGARENGLNF